MAGPIDLDLTIGVDLDVVDEPEPNLPPTDTSTGFLVMSLTNVANPTEVRLIRSPADARSVYATEPALWADVDAWFGTVGNAGGRLYLSPLDTDAAAAVAAIPDAYGPGQIIAPEVVTSLDQVAIRDAAWESNRFYVAQAPDGATDAALITLKDALVSSEGRFAALEADTIIIPGEAGGATREVPASVIAAALMARSDLRTGNPNLAAAGNHTPGASGQVDYALGIKADRTLEQIRTLAREQINTFRVVNQRVRKYGYWTLADLATLPQWWDVGGSRTVMALRAREQAVAEEMMFGQIAADGAFLDKYKGALSGELAEFQRIGAIYGTETDPGYNVDVSVVQNPVSQLAQGLVKAVVTVRTSPFAAALSITLTRRAITSAVA